MSVHIQAARDEHIEETRLIVKRTLRRAKLPPQWVYIVAKDALCSIVQFKVPKDMIGEGQLVGDLLSDGHC